MSQTNCGETYGKHFNVMMKIFNEIRAQSRYKCSRLELKKQYKENNRNIPENTVSVAKSEKNKMVS